MCGSLDVEVDGERGGFYVCRPLNEVSAYLDVPAHQRHHTVFPDPGRSFEGSMVEAAGVTLFGRATMELGVRRFAS